MNLNQLEYFVCAAETLNFTRAANRCFISQTAMTQQIQALEKAIGVPLFVRDKHHVKLTDAGVIYLKEARKILEQSEEAIRLAQLAANGANGELVIGYLAGFGQTDCTDILNDFHIAYPGIKIKLHRDTMSGLMTALERGECDIAFALTSSQFQNQYHGIRHRFLKSYPLMAVLPKDHALSGNEAISFPELQEERFIIMQPAGRAMDQMEELFLIYERGGFRPEIAAFDEEPENIMLMVSLGMGICLMPEYIVRNHRRSHNLTILPVIGADGSSESLDFEISWSDSNRNPALENLLMWMKQE